MIGQRVGSFVGTILGSAIGSSSDDEGGGAPIAGRNIIVIAGQSNGNGFAFSTGSPGITTAYGFNGSYTGVYQMDKLSSTNGDPLVYTTTRGPVFLSPRTGDANGDFGIELSLGRYLDRVQPNKFHIIKHCIPSASLASNWKAIGSNYPVTPPHLIDQFITFMQTAATQLSSTIRCVIWVQGEADALGSTGATYQTNLTDLINTVRGTFPSLPFIIHKLHTGAGGPDNATVRTAEANVVGGVANTSLADLDSLNITTLHLTPDQYVAAGKIDGKLVCAALGLQVPPVADFRKTSSNLNATFTDLSTDDDGTIASWAWTFGDGGTSTLQSPTHAYAANGTYTVSLTVTDNNGLTNTITKNIIIAPTTWTVDATSTKGVPADNTSNEWTAVVAATGIPGVPTATWNMQEASGTLASSPAGVTLGFNNAPLYQQAVAGWTRKAVAFTDGTNNQNFRNTTTAPDPSTTSIAILAYVSFPAAPAAIRDILSSTSNVDLRWDTNGKLRGVFGATSDLVNSVASTVTPVIMQINRTTNTVTVFTLTEKYFGTWAAPNASPWVGFGGVHAPAAGASILYAAEFSGSAAEFTATQARTMLEALGWTPSFI